MKVLLYHLPSDGGSAAEQPRRARRYQLSPAGLMGAILSSHAAPIQPAGGPLLPSTQARLAEARAFWRALALLLAGAFLCLYLICWAALDRSARWQAEAQWLQHVVETNAPR